MKENVLDVLIYLFENYFDADLESEPEPNRDTLKEELERAGFAEREVERALEWLEELSQERGRARIVPTSRSIRVFDSSETARLSVECRGYLLHLENIGILNPSQRELAIDRLLALNAEEVDIDQVKWVVLMVLFSQPGQETAYSRMEDLVFADQAEAVH